MQKNMGPTASTGHQTARASFAVTTPLRPRQIWLVAEWLGPCSLYGQVTSHLHPEAPLQLPVSAGV